MAGIQTRQLPRTQVKAFGRGRGPLAKNDQIGTELIARFIGFYPVACCRLRRGKLLDLRTPAITRRQFVDIRKSALQQNKANLKNGTAD